MKGAWDWRFDLETVDRTFILFAPTEEERDLWVNGINRLTGIPISDPDFVPLGNVRNIYALRDKSGRRNSPSPHIEALGEGEESDGIEMDNASRNKSPNKLVITDQVMMTEGNQDESSILSVPKDRDSELKKKRKCFLDKFEFKFINHVDMCVFTGKFDGQVIDEV